MNAQLIRERRLVFHAAEIPGGNGCARQRNLQVDEITGKALTVVQFDTQWKRPIGFNHRDFEWLILEGTVRLGDDELGAMDYIFMPGGARLPEMAVEAGSRAVVRRRNSWFFEESDWQQPWANEPLKVLPYSDVTWEGVSNLAILRESSGDRTLLMKSDSSQKQEWPADAEAAILLDGRAHVSNEKFPAPIAIIGDLSDEPVPAVSGEVGPVWLIFTSTNADPS